MIQIQLSDVTLILGAKHIFENLNWEIQDGQKIGLIGPNGAGKSSLFKLILGEYTPELGGDRMKFFKLTVFPAKRFCHNSVIPITPFFVRG